jgi:hypothetical protein
MRQGLNDKWSVFAGAGLTPMVAEASPALMLKSPLSGAKLACQNHAVRLKPT